MGSVWKRGGGVGGESRERYYEGVLVEGLKEKKADKYRREQNRDKQQMKALVESPSERCHF